jgi:hypothetical protein
MAIETPRCQICGEPMPEGEEMFNYHGLSGPCPKPTLPKPSIEAVIGYVHRETGGKFWLHLRVNRAEERAIGPFDTSEERQRAHDDLLSMMRSVGAQDLPARIQ